MVKRHRRAAPWWVQRQLWFRRCRWWSQSSHGPGLAKGCRRHAHSYHISMRSMCIQRQRERERSTYAYVHYITLPCIYRHILVHIDFSTDVTWPCRTCCGPPVVQCDPRGAPWWWIRAATPRPGRTICPGSGPNRLGPVDWQSAWWILPTLLKNIWST